VAVAIDNGYSVSSHNQPPSVSQAAFSVPPNPAVINNLSRDDNPCQKLATPKQSS
jgi:hypothetical protein